MIKTALEIWWTDRPAWHWTSVWGQLSNPQHPTPGLKQRKDVICESLVRQQILRSKAQGSSASKFIGHLISRNGKSMATLGSSPKFPESLTRWHKMPPEQKHDAAHEPECSHVEHFCGTNYLNVKYKVWSVECKVWNAECGDYSVKCKVWSVKCRVWMVQGGI